MKNVRLVTNNDSSVSFDIGPWDGVRLSLHRRIKGKSFACANNNKSFKTQAEAQKFALEHGFLKLYGKWESKVKTKVRPWITIRYSFFSTFSKKRMNYFHNVKDGDPTSVQQWIEILSAKKDFKLIGVYRYGTSSK